MKPHFHSHKFNTFVEPDSPEPKVRVLIPMYKPLQVTKCKKCGTCCRNLLDDSHGITVGMFLTPKETTLFDKSLISPFYAFGVNNPKEIISYQLNVNECPYINGNNKCQIYDQRPLTCRAFPVEILTASKNTVSRRCPTISSMIKEGEVSEDIENLDNEIDVASKLYRWRLNRIPKYIRKGLTPFLFDLKTKKWAVLEMNHLKKEPKVLIRIIEGKVEYWKERL